VSQRGANRSGKTKITATFPRGWFCNKPMSSSESKRLFILSGVALIILGILIARWIAGWGLVTIHVTDAPIGKVIASIARQGHVRVESSIDPSKLVSMDVDRVPVAEAVDTLAIRADAGWRLVYLAAKTKSDVNAALITLRGSGAVDDWVTYFYPGPPVSDTTVIDPRYLELTIEGPEQNLQKLLNQAAQKSGAMVAVPKDWSPETTHLPKANQVRKVIPSLVKSVHGATAEFFFLSERRRHWENPAGEGPFSADADSIPMNPDWIEQRQLAEVDKLPPEQQEAAKKDIQDRKAVFASMKGLTPEERRAKWQQTMNNPDMIDKIADRMLMRDVKQTPDQRITRAMNYLNRKAAAKAAAAGGH